MDIWMGWIKGELDIKFIYFYIFLLYKNYLYNLNI